MFGASDEVLGALESGVDFERRNAEIYQSCRTPAQIDAAFDALQKELEEQIEARLAATRAQLLESFDEDVHERLRVSLDATAVHLDRLSRCLWRLTQHELGSAATFDEAAGTFDLSASTVASLGAVSPGRYRLLTPGRDITGDHLYRLGHPLAQTLVDRASARSLSPAEKVAAQRRIRDLEAERNRKRRALFDAQDQIDRRKDGLISDVEARLRQQVETEPLFTIRWRVE